jgi:IMP dehydrogenase
MNKQTIIKDKIVPHQALTYDDILLLPNYTEIKRTDVDLTTVLHPQVVLKIPVVSSPMDTVTESDMAAAIARAGGLGIIHRNLTVSAQSDQVAAAKKSKTGITEKSATTADGSLLIGAAVGVGADLDERVKALLSAGADVLVVDSAHGYSKFVIDAVRQIRGTHPRIVIMAGNIATFDGAKALISAGADILRVGMGPGSICTTRIITGMGVPQISAVAAVVRATDGTRVTVVADGGIRQIGDMAKALAFGAHAVMLGSLLARFDESPGEKTEINGKFYKPYRGMGSVGAMKKGGAERYGQNRSTDEKKLIAEGVEGLVEYKGPVADYLFQIEGSLRSSFYYLGARTLEEFFRSSRAIKISNAGLLESHPHTITLSDAGGNYLVDKK